MYLPLMAVAVLLVLALQRLRFWQAAVTAVCVALAAGTVLRNQEYESRLRMAQTIVERRPHGRAHFLLGNELLVAGQRDAALAAFRQSARDYPGGRFALATELLAEGQADAAVPELQLFLAAMPATHQTVPPARDLLGRAYLLQRRYTEAAEQFQALRQMTPPYRGPGNDVAYNLGYALAASGRLSEAVPALEEAVTANPADTSARDLLARVRAALSSMALTKPPN
jgi:tetratricopeptide (TPR) repeat protein